MELAPSGGTSFVQYNSIAESDTTQEVHDYGVIPDGQGGALISWGLPVEPYSNQVESHMTDVSSSGTIDSLFPESYGSTGMVLGDNNTGFVSYGRSIVSFTVPSLAALWTYNQPAGGLSLVVSSQGGGVVAKDTINGTDTVVRLKSSGEATTDSWSAASVVNFGGDFWDGATASSNGVDEIAAPPVQLSASPAWYTPSGNGGNAAKQNISVDASQAGAQQTDIANVMQKILNALPGDAKCSNWLQGAGQYQGVSGSEQIAVVLGNNNFEHGPISVNGKLFYFIAAFSGTINADGQHIPGVLPGAVFTINDIGAFFNATANQQTQLLQGRRQYVGGTLRAQASIFIHETAHQITVSGFQDDFGNAKAGRANDKLVDENCRKLIEGLQ